MPYEFTLDDDEQRELLRIARTTVKEHLLSGRTPPGAPHKKSLVAPAAVFVSAHEGPALRGCIGTTQEASPIYKAVQEMAIAAATRDPRFRPVKLEELPQLRFEIAVLGPRTPMTSVADIKIGTHGVQVTSNAGPRPHREPRPLFAGAFCRDLRPGYRGRCPQGTDGMALHQRLGDPVRRRFLRDGAPGYLRSGFRLRQTRDKAATPWP